MSSYRDLANVSDSRLAVLLRLEIDQTRGNEMDKLMAEALARLLDKSYVEQPEPRLKLRKRSSA